MEDDHEHSIPYIYTADLPTLPNWSSSRKLPSPPPAFESPRSPVERERSPFDPHAHDRSATYVDSANELGKTERSLQTFDEETIQQIVAVLRTQLNSNAANQHSSPRYSALEPGTIRVLHLSEDLERPQIPLVSIYHSPESDTEKYPAASASGWRGRYTAVSYTWLEREYSWYGAELPRYAQLRIDDVVVSLQSHVAFILACLFALKIHWVWIDCICINQGDGTERGHQVAHMNNTFRNAEQVIVFLGKSNYETHATLRELCADLNEHNDFTFGSSNNLRNTAGLQEILQHQYWTRAWILQEIALASKLKIICGRFVLDHYRANDLIRRMIGFEIDETVKAHLTLINRIAIGIRPLLLDIVIASRHARCSEPRDALYAKMHLAKDGAMLGEPDYTKSTGSLFHRFAVACVANFHSLRILSFASGHDNALGMPSWVPDWTPRDDMPEMRLRSGYGSLLKQCMHECTASVDDDNKMLIARGWILKRMQRFHKSPFLTMLARVPPDPPLGPRGRSLPKVPSAEDETFLCLIFGCTSILVLARRMEHYVVINIASGGALQQWAQNELNGITQDLRIQEYPITEFKIA